MRGEQGFGAKKKSGNTPTGGVLPVESRGDGLETSAGEEDTGRSLLRRCPLDQRKREGVDEVAKSVIRKVEIDAVLVYEEK